LKAFAKKFNAEPGWTLVTGDKKDIDTLLRALGAFVEDKNNHTSMVLIDNDAAHYWTRVNGLSSPTVLIKAILEVADRE
jgi:protein SCO1/2